MSEIIDDLQDIIKDSVNYTLRVHSGSIEKFMLYLEAEGSDTELILQRIYALLNTLTTDTNYRMQVTEQIAEAIWASLENIKEDENV